MTLNTPQGLICHKNTNQPTNQPSSNSPHSNKAEFSAYAKIKTNNNHHRLNAEADMRIQLLTIKPNFKEICKKRNSIIHPIDFSFILLLLHCNFYLTSFFFKLSWVQEVKGT